MKNRSYFRTVAAAAVLLTTVEAATASVIADNFAFYDSSSSLIASGTFSYDSSKAGVLSYGDLTGFSIALFPASPQTYNLTFANSLTPGPGNDYVYFGYDTMSNSFLPAAIPGYAGPQSGILAATDGTTGFFIDPLLGSADPAGTGADGLVAAYGPYTTATAVSYTVSAVPEPSSWAMMVFGFFGLAVIWARKGAKPLLTFGDT